VHKGYCTAAAPIASWTPKGPAAIHRMVGQRRAEPLELSGHEHRRPGAYESELELQLYREYKDVVGIFTYAVETERRFYLCNAVDLKVRTEGGDVYYEVSMGDAWVWDMYRPARFVKSAKVLTFRDVSIEEIAHSDLQVPDSL
jgi:hypothetical protein